MANILIIGFDSEYPVLAEKLALSLSNFFHFATLWDVSFLGLSYSINTINFTWQLRFLIPNFCFWFAIFVLGTFRYFAELGD
jgi:hypothetical protein